MMKFLCGIYEKLLQVIKMLYAKAITLLDIVTENCKRMRQLGIVRSA